MTTPRFLALLLVAPMLTATAHAADTVRVESRDGAPRLLVDGKPVRARVFWGAPGSRPLAVAPQGRVLSFEFTPAHDEPARATLHFRFGEVPGELVLDDLRVTDLSSGRDVLHADFEAGPASFTREWHAWPQGAANTVGTVAVEPGCGQGGSAGLRLRLRAPAAGAWPDFHVYHTDNLSLRKDRRYRVSLWAKAEPARDLTVAFYRPGNPYVRLGGPPDAFASQIQLAHAAGVDLVSFPVDCPWPPPGQPADFSTAEGQCRAVLDANPHALLIPRLGMDPPPWWLQAHPDDAMVWDQGPRETPGGGGVVVASPDYRRDAAARLTALIAHLEKTLGPHIAGYHPCGQNTGEWFYQDSWGPGLNGYAKGDERAFRSWLTARYATDAALRAAWNDPAVSLATARVPSPAARRAAPAGALRDSRTERPLIDFAQFQQEAMADCVRALARAAREASGGRKLVLFFSGYVFEFAALHFGPATSGHYALRRLLDCPDIDVLCSPISYFDRGVGGSAPSMTAAESVALSGKMWLSEDDTRTHLGTGRAPGWQEGAKTQDESVHMLLRNTGQCALRNFGTWWMDLLATGWFDDPRLWREMDRLKVLDEPFLREPRPYRPDVAAVLDEASLVRVAAGGRSVTVPGVYEARRALGRIGAPYGQYLQDDVAAGKVPARLLVFLSSWRLTPEQRRDLQAAARNRLAVWCYAPGWYDGEAPSLDAMRDLTGFALRPVSPPRAWAEPTAIGRQKGLTRGFGVAGPVKPLFAATDARPEEILATYPDGSAAVALRTTGQGGSLFVGVPGLSSELLRLAARQAGVHLYTDTDCNVTASGPWVVLHAAADGPLTLDTGRPGPVRDLLSGAMLSPGPRLKLPIKKGETRILVTGPAN